MSVTDPIADLLTRIRNANQMRYNEVVVPKSNVKLEIVKILKDLLHLIHMLAEQLLVKY